MPLPYTLAELEGYLDETLPVERMAAIEAALRGSPELLTGLAKIVQRRDAGVHSLAEIWRRGRVTCPDRSELGQLLLGLLDEEQANYLRFHLEIIGCRYCAANYADLQAQQNEAAEQQTVRRRKYYQSSIGLLRNKAE